MRCLNPQSSQKALHASYRDSKATTVINASAIGLTIVLMGIFMIGMPKYLDDWAYMHSFSEMPAFWTMHYESNNGRLANLTAMVLMSFPKWIGSGIALGGWAYVLFASWRLAGVDWRKWSGIPVSLALFGFLVPWRDHLGSLDFQCNYVYASAIAMLVLEYLKNENKSWIPAFLMCLLLGAWHEGFAVPVGAGITVCMIRFPNLRIRKNFLALIGLFCGLLVVALSPGFQARLLMEKEGVTPIWRIISTFETCLPYISALAIWGFCALLKPVKSDLCPRWWFVVTSGLASTLIVVVAEQTPRTGWWASLMAVDLLMLLSKRYLPQLRRGYSPSVGILSAIIFGLFIWHWVSVDISVMKIRETFRTGINDWIQSDREDPVFGKIQHQEESALIAGLLPDPRFFSRLRYTQEKLEEDTGSGGFWIVPAELETVSVKTVVPVKGTGEIFEKGGWYFMPLPKGWSKRYEECEMDLGCELGVRRADCIRFRSVADGREYLWIFPIQGWWRSHFR